MYYRLIGAMPHWFIWSLLMIYSTENHLINTYLRWSAHWFGDWWTLWNFWLFNSEVYFTAILFPYQCWQIIPDREIHVHVAKFCKECAQFNSFNRENKWSCAKLLHQCIKIYVNLLIKVRFEAPEDLMKFHLQIK